MSTPEEKDLPDFEITTKEDGEIVMRLTKKIDGNTSDAINDAAITALKSAEDITKFVFDVSDVTYVSSSGLRMFSQISNVCRKRGIPYQIIEMRPDIYRIFQLTGYANVFDIKVKEEQI